MPRSVRRDAACGLSLRYFFFSLAGKKPLIRPIVGMRPCGLSLRYFVAPLQGADLCLVPPQFTKIRQHLRLNQRFTHPEITNVKCLGHKKIRANPCPSVVFPFSSVETRQNILSRMVGSKDSAPRALQTAENPPHENKTQPKHGENYPSPAA